MVYCNISAMLVAIIKLKYLKKRQILEIDANAERLTKLVNETFNQVELKVAFKAPSEIGKPCVLDDIFNSLFIPFHD